MLYVHVRNFSAGKTTNERYSKKATNSFSEMASQSHYESEYNGGDDATESLIGDGSSRAGSIVADDNNP